jgi:TolB-like protein
MTMSLVSELRRRNVFRMAVLYAGAAWLIMQVVDVLEDPLRLPDWTASALLAVLVIGFPIALALSWFYELTPEGVTLDEDVKPDTHLPAAGRRVDFIIIAVMAAALLLFAYDKWWTDPPPERSVAALPFVAHSSDPDSKAFASGIHDDLLTQLTRIPGLRVTSRGSVNVYRGTTKNLRQIGEELGVKHILDGSVQKAGDRIRINVQLIDATDDSHLWAETYDRELTTQNIFAIQSDIAGEVVRVLSIELNTDTRRAMAERPTDNLEAYRDYADALVIFNHPSRRLNTPDFEKGIELLKSAVARDPHFALAWARMASELSWGVRENDVGVTFDESLARVEEIDPGLPQVHLLRAYRASSDKNFDKALAELELAERKLPGDANVYQARYWVLQRMGRYAEAFENIQRALIFNPYDEGVVYNYGLALTSKRRYEEARTHFHTVLDTFPGNWQLQRALAEIDEVQFGDYRSVLGAWLDPGAPKEATFYEWFVALTLYQVGDLERAVDYARNASIGFEKDETWAYLTAEEVRAWIYRDAGLDADSREARALAEQKARERRDQNPDDPWSILALARLAAMSGDNETALRLADDSARLAELTLADHDQFDYLWFRVEYGAALCLANGFSAAEGVWRHILSEENGLTLLSLVAEWPQCKRSVVETDVYRRLEAEFGHLSQGIPAPRG